MSVRLKDIAEYQRGTDGPITVRLDGETLTMLKRLKGEFGSKTVAAWLRTMIKAAASEEMSKTIKNA